jgi:hypothetical protein
LLPAPPPPIIGPSPFKAACWSLSCCSFCCWC